MSESLDFFPDKWRYRQKIANCIRRYMLCSCTFYISLQKSLPSILQFLLLSLKSQSVVFGKVHLKISTVFAWLQPPGFYLLFYKIGFWVGVNKKIPQKVDFLAKKWIFWQTSIEPPFLESKHWLWLMALLICWQFMKSTKSKLKNDMLKSWSNDNLILIHDWQCFIE